MLDFKRFITYILIYKKCIENIEIWTSYYNGKFHPNLRYKINLKSNIIGRQLMRCSFFSNTQIHEKKIKYYNKRDNTIMFIQSEYLINSGSFINTNIYIDFILMILRSYNIELNCKIQYCGEYYEGSIKEISYRKYIGEKIDFEENKIYYEEKYKKYYDDKLEKLYQKSLSKHQIFRIVDRIERLIKSGKNAYIMSKLLNNDLQKKDVEKYPELINTTDELIKLKLLIQ